VDEQKDPVRTGAAQDESNQPMTAPDSAVQMQADPTPPKQQSIIGKIWRVLYPILIFFAFQFAVSIAMSIVLTVLYIMKMPPGTAVTDYMPQIADMIMSKVLWMTLVSDAVMVPLFAFLYIRQRKGQRRVPLSSFGIADYALTAVLAVAANFAVSGVISGFSLTQYFSGYEAVMNGIESGSLALQIVTVGIVGPVLEEFLMRGVVLGRLRRYMKTVPAVLIQAAMFGFIHLNLLQGLYAAIFGVIMGYLYVKYESIVLCIVFHITLNTMSVILPSTFGEDINAFWFVGAGTCIAATCLFLISRRKTASMAAGEPISMETRP